MKYIKRECLVCSAKFSIPKFRLKHGRGQTCSHKCRYQLHSQRQVGKGNAHWGGGVVYHQGYRMILNPTHPHAKGNGYVLEHRLVVEKTIGRYLKPKEVIHHINKDKLDNRPENLLITNASEHHSSFHKIFSCKFCSNSHMARGMCWKHYMRWWRKSKHH